jgi:hypothetical protein
MQYNKNYISIPHFVVIGGKQYGNPCYFDFNDQGMAWALYAILKNANDMDYVHIMKKVGNYEETIKIEWIS